MSPIHEASRTSAWVRLQLGREIRVARYLAGMTQREVGRAIGRSGSWISLVEAGKVPGISVRELMMISAAVGLKLYVNVYPAGRRPLDSPQLEMLTRFNTRIHSGWRRELEKVMPKQGDLRAVDELISIDGVSCAIEAITRFASVEAQVRAARAKQRDVGATRLILLVKGSHLNRRMLGEAAPTLQAQFPIGSRMAFRHLAAAEDPGGDCLILI